MASSQGGGGARIRRRYFYFCSEGSIYTVSTVGRRRRMGKYIKKTKNVQNMEVSQSSLLGVRTRARALALDKRTSENPRKHSLNSTPTISKPRKCLQSRTPSPKNEPCYMQLRSRRRLEKESKHFEKESKHHEKEEKFAGERTDDQTSASEPRGSSGPSSSNVEFMCMYDQELLDMPPRNSCSSRSDFAPVAVSATTAPSTDAVSHSIATSPAQPSLDSSNCVAPAVMLTQARAMSGRAASRMLTRNQKQEFISKLLGDAKAMETDIQWAMPEAASPCGNVQREMEVEPCFGETSMIAGPSKERQQGPNTRSQTRESTLDRTIEDVGAPGSTSRMHRSSQIRSSSAPPFSRSNEAPSSTEIEAFFASAEQKERRRFIDRYNFDPLTEKPSKGRYLWLKE